MSLKNKIFNIHGKVCTKLLMRLHLGFSHLCEHKLWYNFEDILNLPCPCITEPETAIHFSLGYHIYNVIWANLMNDFVNIDTSLSNENGYKLVDVLQYGNSKLNTKTNQSILICTLKFLKDTQIWHLAFLRNLYSSKNYFLFCLMHYKRQCIIFVVVIVNIFCLFIYILCVCDFSLPDQQIIR